MNNTKTTTLAIASLVATMALTAATFTIPQQAFAGGHHHHHNNSIKVDQQINQQNQCTGVPLDNIRWLADGSSTVCLNFGDNSVDIHR